MNPLAALLQGQPDPRGLQGMLTRGKNVYNGNSFSSRSGTKKFGQATGKGPTVSPNAVARRLAARKGVGNGGSRAS